ncbi:MAG: hypothetical protein ACRD2R_08105 [Terriglobales bacterium]
MIPILLIAGNVLREQRWPVLFLVVWAAVSAGVYGFGEKAELVESDFLFLLGQQAVYAVGFSAFVAAFAVHNERKSRRILAVLSKSIGRGQYLAGMLAGVCLCFTIYCAAIGLASSWGARKLGVPAEQYVWLVVVLLASCLLAAAIALFFSVFLNPLTATAATALVVASPAVLAPYLGEAWAYSVPIYALSTSLLHFSVDPAWHQGGGLVGLAVVEAAVFWLAATWVFERRDIAVAVE